MNDRTRTPAQIYSLVFGAVLLLAGILGFFADSSFGDLGGNVQGDDLIVFEVNGWHNVVHILSGVVASAGVAALYYELRSAKEGAGPEVLASLFD